MTIVLSAAMLHALWNALVKASDNRLAVLGLIAMGNVVLGVVIACFSPIPNVASWWYILGSTAIHFAYFFLLYHSYRLGDLSHVYPIARGMAPVLVALGAQVFAGETLPPLAWLGILTASAGIFILSGNVFRGTTPPIVVLTAMATGVIIASYSLVDGIGVRLAGSESGYIGWLFIFQIFPGLFIFQRIGVEARHISRKTLYMGLMGGVIAAMAYGLVIYAKSFSALGMVSTLRETSVVFAAIIGMVWLHERPWKKRLFASCIVAAGVILMTLASR
ncbi:MAG: hypothetical protein CSA68_00865 [Rhodobacterales bacterium]|nr:MAG: hypothetical protein CSA68_00865 [Rhodobacterales bacterium]